MKHTTILIGVFILFHCLFAQKTIAIASLLELSTNNVVTLTKNNNKKFERQCVRLHKKATGKKAKYGPEMIDTLLPKDVISKITKPLIRTLIEKIPQEKLILHIGVHQDETTLKTIILDNSAYYWNEDGTFLSKAEDDDGDYVKNNSNIPKLVYHRVKPLDRSNPGDYVKKFGNITSYVFKKNFIAYDILQKIDLKKQLNLEKKLASISFSTAITLDKLLINPKKLLPRDTDAVHKIAKSNYIKIPYLIHYLIKNPIKDFKLLLCMD